MPGTRYHSRFSVTNPEMKQIQSIEPSVPDPEWHRCPRHNIEVYNASECVTWLQWMKLEQNNPIYVYTSLPASEHCIRLTVLVQVHCMGGRAPTNPVQLPCCCRHCRAGCWHCPRCAHGGRWSGGCGRGALGGRCCWCLRTPRTCCATREAQPGCVGAAGCAGMRCDGWVQLPPVLSYHPSSRDFCGQAAG
jgi:hypothetical protein